MRRVILLLLILVVAVGGLAVVFILGPGAGGGEPQNTLTPEEVEATATALAVTGGDGDGAQTAPSNQVPVVIAVQNLPRGYRLSAQDVDPFNEAHAVVVAGWPADHVLSPESIFTSVEELEGMLVRSDIPVGSPILRSEMAQDALSLGDVGSDAALLLEPGQIAVSLPLDITGVGSVAYGLQTGDYIDVILSLLFIDVDEQFQTRLPNTISVVGTDESGATVFSPPVEGRWEPGQFSPQGVLIGPIESQRPRLVTQRTVSRAKVIFVGYLPPDGKFLGVMTPTEFETEIPETPELAEGEAPPPQQQQQQAPPEPTATFTPWMPLIVTVGVSPQDALVLVWAVDAQIPITLALRPANDPGTVVPTTAVSLQYLIDTYGITQPPVLPFALEPGIFRLRSAQRDIMDIFGERVFGTKEGQ